jgi:tRNA-specific 2-thiouridylase
VLYEDDDVLGGGWIHDVGTGTADAAEDEDAAEAPA